MAEDIERAARNLIEAHGKNAVTVAEKRAANAELGDSGGAAHIWHQIEGVIRQIQAKQPGR
jgi:hypothetical protein